MSSNTLQEQAYHSIRKSIIYCEYEPQQKISENDLTDKLSIGRTPVREALIQLRHQELVYTIPQSGTYVSQINLTSAHNARFVREQLERQIMIECCAKLTAQHEKIMTTILEQQEKAIQENDKASFFQLDNLFHQTCYEIAGRRLVWDWQSTHNIHLERFRWLSLTSKDIQWSLIIDKHYELFKALKNRDTDEADYLTAAHLHKMLHDLQYLLDLYPNYFIQSTDEE